MKKEFLDPFERAEPEKITKPASVMSSLTWRNEYDMLFHNHPWRTEYEKVYRHFNKRGKGIFK